MSDLQNARDFGDGEVMGIHAPRLGDWVFDRLWHVGWLGGYVS